jgi:predicted transcriptional regulator
MSETQSSDVKSAAHRLIDTLPADATWDDIMYRVYVRQCVDASLKDADAGRVVDVAEVRRQFDLMP